MQGRWRAPRVCGYAAAAANRCLADLKTGGFQRLRLRNRNMGRVRPFPSPVVLRSPRTESDAELVERAIAGEEHAFNMLYERHAQFVASVIFRVGRHSDVDDVVQETFIIAFRKLDTLTHVAALRGWLARIALSQVHRSTRFDRLWRLFRSEREERALVGALASSAASPEARIQLKRLDSVVQTLPGQERQAWTLRYVLGCTLDEVAEACACSLATVKRRLTAATAVVGVISEFEEQI